MGIRSLRLFCLLMFCSLTTTIFSFPPLVKAAELTSTIFAIAPWGYEDSNGNPAGIEYEIIMAISREIQEPITVQVRPYKRMIRQLEMGAIDFAIFFRSARSEQSGEPLAKWGELDIIVIGRRGSDLHNYDDLKGKKVAVRLGGYFEPRFDKDSSLEKYSVDDYAQGVRMLKNGRVDYIVGTAATLYYEFAKQGVAVSDLGTPLFLSKKEDWLHFSRKSANQDKKEKLVTAVNKLVAEGVLNQIFSKYLPKEWQHH